MSEMVMLIKTLFSSFQNLWGFFSYTAIDFVGCHMHALPKHLHLRVNIKCILTYLPMLSPTELFLFNKNGCVGEKAYYSTSPLKLLARYQGEGYNMSSSEVIH